ncbi:uncharacterized protein [Lepisosteus oculatus]|uniref:uncharacterized protein isoform X1 n=2 Tax=Lepisosteus oculatus TaxID=7918 RepID=UPI0035F50CEA
MTGFFRLSDMTRVRKAVEEALWGMCVGDAMSMPVHWYYNVRDIKEDFNGWISRYQAPKNRHPSSIMTLSNSAGSGRTSHSNGSQLPVVGNIILHDKLKYWKTSEGSVHYHQGLQAGDNTLNVLCALKAARTLTEGQFRMVNEEGARAAVLSDYVHFMTTPGSHEETYAESFHRSFFADWQEHKPVSPSKILEFAVNRCRRKMRASHPDSQLDAIGCLPMAIPFILLSATEEQDQAVTAAVELVRLTHPHPKLDECVTLYARTLHAVLNGACLRQQAKAALRCPVLDAWETCLPYIDRAARSPEERLGVHQTAVASLGLACYMKGALSSLFYLAYEYYDDFSGGILANTNCGGENCNRGAALGALLGAASVHQGGPIPQAWKGGLVTACSQVTQILTTAGMKKDGPSVRTSD